MQIHRMREQMSMYVTKQSSGLFFAVLVKLTCCEGIKTVFELL